MQANQGVLAELTGEEQSLVLSYQLVQLLVSLTHHTQGKDAPTSAAVASTPRPRLELTAAGDAASASRRR